MRNVVQEIGHFADAAGRHQYYNNHNTMVGKGGGRH